MNIDRIIKKCQSRKSASDVIGAKMVAMAVSTKASLECAVFAENRRSTSGVVSPWTLHAEEFLVRKLQKLRARERFGSMVVYVLRFLSSGMLGISKPCEKCKTLLTRYGIRRVFYSDRDGQIKSLSLP